MHPIKAILFDLDGVLVNTTVLHYQTFRDAVQDVVPSFRISWEEHESRFEGMSTNLKLHHLREDGVVTDEQCKKIFEKKQELITKSIPTTVSPRESLRLLLITLNNQGFRLFCCSNSVRKTLNAILTQLGVLEFFEATYSNEDVQNPKPSPEIYQLAMRKSFLIKEQCLIVEDSHVGRTAAYASGAHVLEVEDAEDVTLSLLREQLYSIEKTGRLYPRSLPLGRPFTVQIVLPLETLSFEDLSGAIQRFIPTHIPEEHYKCIFHIVVGKGKGKVPHNNKIDSLFWDLPSNLSYTYCKSYAEIPSSQNPLVVVHQLPPAQWKCDSFYKCLLNPSYGGAIVTTYEDNSNSDKHISVSLDTDGLVTKIASPQSISPYSAIGVYGWRTADTYIYMNLKGSLDIVSTYQKAIHEDYPLRSFLYKGV